MRRFITDASHELRTPLTTIRGFAELYRQGAARDVELLMSRIESESSRMGLLVEDLLLLARLDAQRPLERHRVDLLALASDAVHDAQSIAPKRRSPWKCSTGPAPRRCLGDEARLRQVLGNLVANALQHTPETAAITVRVGTDEDDAILEVCDEGPGMSRRRRAPRLRAVLPRRLLARAGQRRHRTGPVDRRLAGVRARRHGQRHHRTGPGLPVQGSLPRIADVPASGRPERSSQFCQRGFDLGLSLVEGLRRRVVVDVGEAEVGRGCGPGRRARADAAPPARR